MEFISSIYNIYTLLAEGLTKLLTKIFDEKNIPYTLSVYIFILLIIVIIFNISYVIKSFDDTPDKTTCNSMNFISVIINGIIWGVIITTTLFSLSAMKIYIKDTLHDGKIIMTYGKILSDIFYNLGTQGLIYLLSGFIFAYGNNFLFNNINHSLVEWIWIPVGLFIFIVLISGLIVLITKENYDKYKRALNFFNSYLSPFIITISLFSLITSLISGLIYIINNNSPQIYGIVFLILFILLLLCLIIMFIYPDPDIGIQFVTNYIKRLKKFHQNSKSKINDVIIKVESPNEPEKKSNFKRFRNIFIIKNKLKL